MPPSAPRGLLGCDEPDRSSLAIARARKGFRVGRADGIEIGEPVARRPRARTERKCHLSSPLSAGERSKPERQRRLRVRGLSTRSDSRIGRSPGSYLAMRSDLSPTGRGESQPPQILSIAPLFTDRWIASKLRTFSSISSSVTG